MATAQELIDDKKLLRQKAAQSYLGIADAARQQDTALTAAAERRIAEAERQGAADITRGSAEALAATQGTGMGRAGLAGASQVAADAGAARGRLQVDVAGSREQAAQDSAQRKMDALGADQRAYEAIGEMGSSYENTASQRADIDARINSIVKANKGFFNDDEDTMHQQIAALITPDMPDELKEYVATRAFAIKKGKEDV
jgi:hypothetical protein